MHTPFSNSKRVLYRTVDSCLMTRKAHGGLLIAPRSRTPMCLPFSFLVMSLLAVGASTFPLEVLNWVALHSTSPLPLFCFFPSTVSAGCRGEYLPVATTRPETVLGDTAVAVNPEGVRQRCAQAGAYTITPGFSGGIFWYTRVHPGKPDWPSTRRCAAGVPGRVRPQGVCAELEGERDGDLMAPLALCLALLRFRVFAAG